MLRHFALLLFVGSLPGVIHAQGTAADYERSDKLFKLTSNKVFRTNITPNWSGDDQFSYRIQTRINEHEFVLVNAKKGVREPAFDHEKLAAALAKQTDRKVNAKLLPLELPLRFSDDFQFVHFKAFEKTWQFDRKSNELTKAELPLLNEERNPPRRSDREQPNAMSPDQKWEVKFADGNISVRNRMSGVSTPLTKAGKSDDGFDGRVWWSPDGRRLVAMHTKAAPVRQVNIVESSPRDQLQPKLHTFNYAKPGDPLAISKPHLFDMENRKEIAISDELFSNPWEIGRVLWDADSKRFTFLYNQRGHQIMRVIAVDAENGKASAVIDEVSKTFIDYAGKFYLNRLNRTNEIIWMSERDGWNHLYLIDAKTGAAKPITHGEWVVRQVDKVDDEKRQIWFWAGGIRPEQDPYHRHYCRVNFDGTGLVILTEGDGSHSVTPSPNGKYLIDTYSRVDLAPITELRSADDGKLICSLEKADVSALLETGWKWPERFVAKGRDDKTDIYGVIFRPTNFDPSKKYPIIEEIYAGPHDSHVPKTFRPHFGAQNMAELGFIVVRMDGMGTSNRSKAFHDLCWQNLGDAGFPDRVRWIKGAAEKYPYMDLDRVGIYGGSAGGQNAMRAIIAHNDFYKVAVADCGCHDNRMDKVWWNELWMGYPVGPHFAESSNVAQAHKLKGKLLLIVGEMDHNVDPASTMQVVNALVKADKDFDLLVIPGADHGAAGTPYGRRRQKDYFVRHLLGVEPRK